MVLLEAMSRGIYCVASNCETGPADIVNKNNGQLFEVGNVDELTHKLQYLDRQQRGKFAVSNLNKKLHREIFF